MVGGVQSDLAARGEDALARGDWPASVEVFELALRDDDDAELHDGLGRPLWLLRDVERAIAEREAAYAAFRKGGDDGRTVPIALWFAREFLEALGNEPVSRGWLARAEGIVAELPTGPANGWFALTRGRLAPDPRHRDRRRCRGGHARDARHVTPTSRRRRSPCAASPRSPAVTSRPA